MHLSAQQLDRAVGAVLVSAAGDALGSQYEFGPALPDAVRPAFGAGCFGHDVGEWTDDTSMAMPILAALAEGRTLEEPATLAGIVASWRGWSRAAKDVGSQTRAVLGLIAGATGEASARAASEAVHLRTGRSGGTGALMRTGPVALGYVDRSPGDLAATAGRIAQLTHWDTDNVDACALWSLAIRHAILTGELDLRGQIQWIPVERRDRWSSLIAEASTPGVHPRDFHDGNGWVVRAFQGAVAAIVGATSPRDAIVRAVRGGNDADTVAAIAGALAGAVWGASALPLADKRQLHGWPGIDANELTRRACRAVRHGRPDREGWPSAARATVYPRSDYVFPHPHDDRVWIGSIAGLDRLPAEVDAVVSLCRVGTHQVPARCESLQVWLVDQEGRNDHLDFVLAEAADAVAALRAEGRTVFLHCAEGRSRTSAVAALYGIRHRGVPLDRAWSDVKRALPGFAPQPFLRDAVERISARSVANGLDSARIGA